MSDFTKIFLVSFITALATSIVVYVVMSRFDPSTHATSAFTPGPPAAEPAPARAAAPPVQRVAPTPPASPAVPQSVSIPRLVGQPIDQMRDLVLDRGLLLAIDRSAHSNEAPLNHVVSQTPLPGSVVIEGTEVHVVVSLGPKPVAMPDLSGLSKEIAQERIKKLGLSVGRTVMRRADAPEGELIETRPEAGREVQQGTSVDLFVSLGPELAKVPNVRRRTISTAKRLLESAGFVPSRVRWTYDQDYEPGVIVRHKPRGGEMAPMGSEVTLWGSEPDD